MPKRLKACPLGGGQSCIVSTDAIGFLHAQLRKAGPQTAGC